MELSNFYTDNTFVMKYNNVYNSKKISINATWDLQYIGNNLPYDTSNIYTMCTDNDLNKYTVIKSISENINHIKFETENKTAPKNAISFVASTLGYTDMGLNNARTCMPMNNYLSNSTYTNNNYNNLNELDISKAYIYPIIYAIEKTDFEAEIYNETNLPVDDSKIKTITLSELYNNTDKYYITAYKQRLIVNDGNTSAFDLGNTTPVKYIYQNNDNFTMTGVANIGQHYGVEQTPQTKFGFWYRRRSTGVTSSPFGFLSAIKGNDVDTNQKIIITAPITSFDYEPTFDNETKFVDGEHDIWKLCSFTGDNFTSMNGIHVWKAEYILKLIAMSGLYVAWNDFYASDISLHDSPDIAIGEMDKNGFTTGKIIPPNLKSDSKSPNLNYGNYTDSTASPDKYKPIIPDVKPTDPTQFGNYECKSGGVRYYGMTSTQYFAFNQWINGDLESGYEPMKSIVYFAYQPFKSGTTFMSDMDNVKIGGKSSVQMKPLNKSTSVYYLGSYNVNRIHNNFLDFAPYTDITVYIPLCGEINIPTNIAMGNTIKTYLITDSQTGGCTGYVTSTVNSSEILIGHRTGQFVQNMPLSSQEVGLRKQAETNALMSVGASTVATGLGIATGNPMAVIGGIGGIIASTVNGLISSNTNRTQSTGSISDVINFNMPVQCYIRISSPSAIIPDNYGHTVGYMCNKTKTVGECEGYTVCNNVDVSTLSCTETEKQMIKSALENGCYL